MGRLGNHLWATMTNAAMAMKLGINFPMFKETKDYLKLYFKGFENCPSLEESFCGAGTASLIVILFNPSSGTNVDNNNSVP